VRQSQALDGVLETAYTAELVRLASQQLARLAGAAVEQKRIEHLLGLSQGYLSHVKPAAMRPARCWWPNWCFLRRIPSGASRSWKPSGSAAPREPPSVSMRP